MSDQSQPPLDDDVADRQRWQRRRRRAWIIGLSSAVLLCGACCAGVFYTAIAGTAKEVEAQLSVNQLLIDALTKPGPNRAPVQFDYQFWESIGSPGPAYLVRGDKDAGRVAVRGEYQGSFIIYSAILFLNDGTTVELLSSPVGAVAMPTLANPYAPPASDETDDQKLLRELRDSVAANPQLFLRLGVLTKFELDADASAAESLDDIYVIEVAGPHGSGRLRLHSITGEDGKEDVVSGQLILENGDVEELFPANPMEE